MDQVASVFCDASSALCITFYPALTATPVPLPKGCVFVCANTFVAADKAIGAKRGETLVSARVLARVLGGRVGEGERGTLRRCWDEWLERGKGKT